MYPMATWSKQAAMKCSSQKNRKQFFKVQGVPLGPCWIVAKTGSTISASCCFLSGFPILWSVIYLRMEQNSLFAPCSCRWSQKIWQGPNLVSLCFDRPKDIVHQKSAGVFGFFGKRLAYCEGFYLQPWLTAYSLHCKYHSQEFMEASGSFSWFLIKSEWVCFHPALM